MAIINEKWLRFQGSQNPVDRLTKHLLMHE